MEEQDYLKTYDQRAYATPLLSVDSVLFTYHEQSLKVLLVQRAKHPDKGKWGLPGGFIDMQTDKTIEDTVMRKLEEKTGVIPPYIEQLATRGNAVRDKRGWSVTVCYTALIAHQNCRVNISTVSEVEWVDSDRLDEVDLAFDHREIIHIARERLRQKALYSIVPAYALPEKFTLPELQHIHELLIGKKLQKKSFRRRIEQADLLHETDEKRALGGRPATLYTMKKSSGSYTFIRNLG
ncbi:NUDIX hydrolase [Desulfogranum japonicum]|uniref:NUDIX hydrolase n=1 Tax=Desulfogranum japonicum TaxID=231447 RepID=UPI00040432D3|nr:NUDIX hydrolase [Desulfogranum japonicum]